MTTVEGLLEELKDVDPATELEISVMLTDSNSDLVYTELMFILQNGKFIIHGMS